MHDRTRLIGQLHFILITKKYNKLLIVKYKTPAALLLAKNNISSSDISLGDTKRDI